MVNNRDVVLTTPRQRKSKEWLIHNKLVDISPCDVIIGYRADDSYFAFARAFLNGDISIGQLSLALKLGKLGLQYVVKSEQAFSQLTFKGFEAVSVQPYYRKRVQRSEDTRTEYLKMIEIEDTETPTIIDIMIGYKDGSSV